MEVAALEVIGGDALHEVGMRVGHATRVGPSVPAQPGGAFDDEAPERERDQRDAEDTGARGQVQNFKS